jgi:predicted Holliday junction resolvase-like endonuclease
MNCFSIILIFILSLVILTLMIKYKEYKQQFQKKIGLLEDLILELNQNLENQNQKVKLSDDLKIRIKEINKTLNKSIYNFNFEMIEEFSHKK